MLFSLEEELYIFLYAILTGAIIYMFYDFVSVCTKKSSCPIFVCTILDGVTLSVICITVLYISLSISGGIVRFFEFVGVFLGMILYKILLSPLFCFFFGKITDIFCSFFKLFFKILLTPIEFMYKIFIKCIKGLFYPIAWMIKKCLSPVFTRLTRTFHLLCKVRNKT